ncbi:MAG TPA: efflux transporter outer membrane subunit [Steroidobacteraceae bacterium]|nr:efflux transporter outer membrane subunit [Steroidobacteraceae bacterium]
MRPPVAVAVAAGCALAACSLAPRYQRPATAAPPAVYKELGDWKVAVPADTAARGAWWTLFQDQELDGLEAEVSAANQSLKAALARLEEARAQTRIARAAFFPLISAAAGATRQRISTHAPAYAAGASPVYDTFVLGGDLSYEIDVFGRIRNTVSGARATEQASAGDTQALDLSVHAELATDYFALRGLDAQQQLLDQTVADYARALELTHHLYAGGAAALSDVQEAQAQLETARTQAQDTRLRRAQTEHAIAVLVGAVASQFHLEARPLQPDAAIPRVNPGLPSELLERRPDVAAAERRVAAANAAIGVARAAYFPLFTLAAAAGQESTQSGNWLSAPSRFWSVGPQGVLTVFDAGLHAAQSAAAHAAYDEQVANYRATVLTAYQEVEDNLAALRQLELEDVSQAAAVSATQGALEQARFRYQAGVVTYLEVVSTENAALAARLAAVDIATRRIGATVLLVRALGGVWN